MAQIGFALLVFAATVAFAVAQGWRANDLVWGFWISGVVVTLYAAVAVPFFSLIRPCERAQSDSWAIRVIKKAGDSFVNLGAFGLLVVPLLFGATGFMLNSLSPLMPNSTFQLRGGNFFGVFMLAEDALRRFWPLTLVCCISCSSTIFYATARLREDQDDQVASMMATIEALRAGAVVILAMLVQLALGKTGETGATIANYFLLAALLFPWTRIFSWGK